MVHAIARRLETQSEVRLISTRPSGRVAGDVVTIATNKLMLSPRLASELRRFQPDAVLYVPRSSASLSSFIRARMLRRYVPRARHIMLTLQPQAYGWLASVLLSRLCPDLIVAQTPRVEDGLRALGCDVALLPSGVDLTDFQPVGPDKRLTLRVKYDISPDSFVVFHAGHLMRTRNVLLLNRIRAELGCETILAVGSSPSGLDRTLEAELRAGGTRLMVEYVERIAELYQLADCYLFPVRTEAAAIDMPLSVLEALACGIPVVTTPFGSLPLWLQPGPGLRFGASNDDLVAAIRDVRQRGPLIDRQEVRALAEPFSWEAVTDQLAGLCFQHTAWNFASESRTAAAGRTT